MSNYLPQIHAAARGFFLNRLQHWSDHALGPGASVRDLLGAYLQVNKMKTACAGKFFKDIWERSDALQEAFVRDLHDEVAIFKAAMQGTSPPSQQQIQGFSPDGHLKTGHLWPGQNRPAAGRFFVSR